MDTLEVFPFLIEDGEFLKKQKKSGMNLALVLKKNLLVKGD